MKTLGPLLDGLDAQALAAVLALLVLGLGVASVFSIGWALIVMAALVLAYVVLPDRSARS
jgi:hypothetical protein